jgi:hypothetical protein
MVFRSIGKCFTEIRDTFNSFFSFLQYFQIYMSEQKLRKEKSR